MEKKYHTEFSPFYLHETSVQPTLFMFIPTSSSSKFKGNGHFRFPRGKPFGSQQISSSEQRLKNFKLVNKRS